MLKKILLLTAVSLLCGALAGCELNQPRLKDDTNCTRLKRQYLYNQTNPNYEANWTTNSQRDSLKKQMEQNNCS